jgi:hypothetical protein
MTLQSVLRTRGIQHMLGLGKYVQAVAGEWREKEVGLAVAFWSSCHRAGSRWSGALARLLASQDELAGALPGSLLSGLPGLRHQTPV